MNRRIRTERPPEEPSRDLVGTERPLLELPSYASQETKDRLAQALVLVLVRQIRAELSKDIQ